MNKIFQYEAYFDIDDNTIALDRIEEKEEDTEFQLDGSMVTYPKSVYNPEKRQVKVTFQSAEPETDENVEYLSRLQLNDWGFFDEV